MTHVTTNVANPIVNHLEHVRQALENDKGQKFSLFALFRRPNTDEWDLVLSAPWLSAEKMKGLAQVAERVYSVDLPRSAWWRIARIVTLKETDSNLKIIKDALGPTDTIRMFDRPEIAGLDIEEAWVMRNVPPDEERDVIVHFVKEIDGRTGSSRDRWLIFLGLDKRGEADNREGAIVLARQLAAVNNRPAWLLDESGYPMRPIDLTRAQ